MAGTAHPRQGTGEGRCETGEAALGPISIPSRCPLSLGTYLLANQGLEVASQLLHSDGEVLDLLRAAHSLLLEHICPPAVCRYFLHGAAAADLTQHQGLWAWRAPEYRARSRSIGGLPSLLEELHRALLQGKVCQLQHALPMQHVPGVRDSQHCAGRGHHGAAREPLRVVGQARAQTGGMDRSHFPIESEIL